MLTALRQSAAAAPWSAAAPSAAAAPRRSAAFATLRKLNGSGPGKLVLLRHGESTWNAGKLFTGWVDVDLSPRGRREMEHAAHLMLERGCRVDTVYTSVLKRAVSSTMILMSELRQTYRPVVKDWRLNERHYGALQGLSKARLGGELGPETANRIRASFDERPPELPEHHTLSPYRERKYAEVPRAQLPLAESLRDCLDRVRPLWREKIEPDLKSGHDVLVVAHGNSLRGLVKEIDGISDDAIERVSIPNAIPLVYAFDRDGEKLRARRADDGEEDKIISGEFLEERGLLRAALAREEKRKDGEDEDDDEASASSGETPQLTPLEQSLATLESRRKLYGGLDAKAPAAEPSAEALKSRQRRRVRRTIRKPSADGAQPPPLLVIIRHGKTTHNKLKLFTGWEDAPLAPEGRVEAASAGELMAAHGVKLDVVYTSWLSRAIETAWLALAPMDMVWLPIVKTWRLNERMYGALTGLSKKMIQQEYGDAQFKRWRRGYAERPPAVSPFSPHYPGNDARYVDYAHDLPTSFFQTIVRSLAHKTWEVHPALPRTESLKDCMERTVPYYVNTIAPALDARKNVLIASSENAIRGLLMHLCAIPEDRVPEIEIPTGVPMLFDFEEGRVRLLDDGEATPPRERYNFGTGGDLLFTPRGGTDATDPHIYMDDEWFAADDESAACDLELRADLDAVERVEKAYGVRGHIAARPERGHDS